MKIKNIFFGTVGAAAMVGSAISAHAIANTAATEAYDKTQVQPQIRMDLEKDTDTVHFIRDNSDPYVVTKVYRLKNADPYEIRPYLRDIFQSNKISDSPTKVECIKYNDGTGFVVISAEEDRFGPQTNGMGIDQLIASLDKEKLTSSSGSDFYLYFPKYRNAYVLQFMIRNVGMDTSKTGINDQLQRGKDVSTVDPELNALFFYIPKYSKKNIVNMLKYYDQPILQVAVKYTVYEIYAENDGKIGMDFQNWKNNDGMDLLSMGARYRSNWTSTWAGGIAPGTGENNTQYFSFNPKWNSKYLDLLTSIGKAKVMTSGEVLVKNNATATIRRYSSVFCSTKTDTAAAGSYSKNITRTQSASVTAGQTVGTDGTTNIILAGANATVYAVAFGSTNTTDSDGNTYYKYQLVAPDGSSFTKDGKNTGRQTVVTSLNSALTWTNVSSNDMVAEKGPTIKVTPSTTDAIGFYMSVTPYVGRNSTTLDVEMNNKSLTGWNSSGAPRISDNSVKTRVCLSNQGNRFVIGGVDKKEVVRSVTGVPYLRQIPVLGWIFGTESETTKKSQLVVVAECVTKAVDAPLTEAATGVMSEVTNATKDAGEGYNSWGFDQYLIDKPIK